MRFAKRNAYLCSHAEFCDFLSFAGFLMLLIHMFRTANIDSCATGDFVMHFSKLSYR